MSDPKEIGGIPPGIEYERKMVEREIKEYFNPTIINEAESPNLMGVDFHLNLDKFEIVELHRLGVTSLGVSVHRAFPAIATFTVQPTQRDDSHLLMDFDLRDKLLLNVGDNEFTDIVLNEKDGLTASKSDPINSRQFEIPVMCKHMALPGLADNEKAGIDRLRKLGIPTLKCIYPPNRGISNEKSSAVVTLFEEGLRPANSIADIFAEDTRIFATILSYLSKMHSNKVIHGDAQARNFGIRADDSVLVLDLEGHVDFAVEPDNYLIDRFVDDLPEHLQKKTPENALKRQDAMLELGIIGDIKKLLKTILPKDADENQQKRIWGQIESNYLDQLSSDTYSEELADKVWDLFNSTINPAQ